MKIHKLSTVSSTNFWVAENENILPLKAFIWSVEQTAGRGQRGNSWESAPGQNITASVLFHPVDFPAHRQFKISEAIAISIVEFLATLGIQAKVKWPNDIYVEKRKICGILVEHVVTGQNITRTIAGFGININQRQFFSDAPNPVSAVQITGKTYIIEDLVKSLSDIMEKNLKLLDDNYDFHPLFMETLWRNDGDFHKFKDHKEKKIIKAKIINISPEGFLTLQTDSGENKIYAFKEVEFIL